MILSLFYNILEYLIVCDSHHNTTLFNYAIFMENIIFLRTFVTKDVSKKKK